LDHLIALAVHLACFGFAAGALALAVAGVTGRRAVAAGSAAAYAVLGFLINGFAPLVDGLTWLKYASPFYYYSGHDPLGSGLDVVDLSVLGAASVALVAFAALAFQRRDLRA
jgi:ABC-2 type transport system permease protein